jgi:hypothetical protein
LAGGAPAAGTSGLTWAKGDLAWKVMKLSAYLV